MMWSKFFSTVAMSTWLMLKKWFTEYDTKNEVFLTEMKRQVEFFNEKIKESGFEFEKPVELK